MTNGESLNCMAKNYIYQGDILWNRLYGIQSIYRKGIEVDVIFYLEDKRVVLISIGLKIPNNEINL